MSETPLPYPMEPPRPASRLFSMAGENAFSALQALTQNWLRSLLTMLGITVGMLSIVTLVAILQGVKAEVQNQVQGLGANLVLVVPGKLDANGFPNPMAMIGISPFDDADIDALRAVPGVEQISPVALVSGTLEGPNKKTANALVIGTNREGIVMNPTPLAEGAYFTKEQETQNVCVLGSKQRTELFGTGPVLGKTVRAAGRNWKIVGVLRKPDNDGTIGNAMLGLSDVVYLPEKAVRKQVSGSQINRIALKTDYKHPADAMIDAMNAAVKKTHGGREDFSMITQKKGLAIVIKMVNLAQNLLVLIATISLFVAGIGIMNIMLVTVTERTREIGIRKTVGAKRSDIFMQFLIEAIILSILGGLLGLALSALICKLIAVWPGSSLTPVLTAPVIALGLSVCVSVGAIFGVLPAIRASRLNPIDALRHE